MISKKRYLELKKKRKLLHKELVSEKKRVTRYKNYMDTISMSAFRPEFNMAMMIYTQLKTEYRLITELIDSVIELRFARELVKVSTRVVE
jgi:hypothetical protein